MSDGQPVFNEGVVSGGPAIWDELKTRLQLPRANGINQATVCLDGHPPEVMAKTALLWVPCVHGQPGPAQRFSFTDLSQMSNRIANVLQESGIKAGDRLFCFMERVPELYAAVFAGLKIQAVVSPLFSAFGPEAILDRLLDSGAKAIIVSPSLKPRLDEIIDQLPDLEHVFIVDRAGTYSPYGQTAHAREHNLLALMEAASAQFEVPYTDADAYSIMHYTSGTTGKPKGAVHSHQAVIAQAATALHVLDFNPETDLYWCTADPGWVTGTSYGMFGPWSLGVTQLVYEGGFKAEHWYELLEQYGVTVWYTAPTAIRMLMKAGSELVGRYNLSPLRHLASVGEPLNPEAIVWGREVFGGKTFYDTWWQTETGAMHIVNRPGLAVKPGSMGQPFFGVEAAVLDDTFNPLPLPASLQEENTEGSLAIRPTAPSLFKVYWQQESKYQSRFKNGWYLTGDRAAVDAEGYFWFVGREDDVINTAGHLVGPFEVESALIEHPAVAEAGVIGVPDPERLEVIKAYISLKNGYEETEALKHDIAQFVRKRLAAHAYPRQIEVIASLPKTRSGKIMRRLLKAQALGLPLGDTSTLEE